MTAQEMKAMALRLAKIFDHACTPAECSACGCTLNADSGSEVRCKFNQDAAIAVLSEAFAAGEKRGAEAEREDAARFRVLLDRLFHNAPIRADKTIEVDECVLSLIGELRNHTYKNGKQGVIDARTALVRET